MISYNNQADYQADKSARTSSAEVHKCFELSSNSSEFRPTHAQLTHELINVLYSLLFIQSSSIYLEHRQGCFVRTTSNKSYGSPSKFYIQIIQYPMQA